MLKDKNLRIAKDLRIARHLILDPAAGVPEFGASGGATQYRFDLLVEELVRRKYLEPLP